MAIAVSPEEWSKERTLLQRLIKEEGTKVTDAAKELGKSHSTVSLYINGKYPEKEDFRLEVRQYLSRIGAWPEDEEPVEPANVEYITDAADLPFVETDDVKRIRYVLKKTASKNKFGIIAGDPGLGKTATLEKYVRQNPDSAIYIRCKKNDTPKSLLEVLADALGLPEYGSASQITRRVIKHLKRHPMLLIFDEADLLRTVDKYETIRDIYDECGNIGVLLCGNLVLAEMFLDFAEMRPELKRLADRASYHQRLQGPSREEIELMLERVNLTTTARKELIHLALNPRKGGLRNLVSVLDVLLDMTRGKRIDEGMVLNIGNINLGANA